VEERKTERKKDTSTQQNSVRTECMAEEITSYLFYTCYMVMVISLKKKGEVTGSKLSK
jgi:hypothetical protein